MENLKISVCSETGICSIIRDSTSKIDLMPTEAQAIREAVGDKDAVRAVIAECDATFAESLTDAELEKLIKAI